MKALLAALAAVALSAGANAAFADAHKDATKAATTPASPGVSIETTTIADLMAKPETKAVVDKHIPALAAAPELEQVKGMSLKQLSAFPQAQLNDEKLAAIQADFDALTK